LNVSLYIAKRYLFSKKSVNAINLISIISLIVVAFVTMAMIIVLSAFNGIEDLITSRYNAFDAGIEVLPAKGKTFNSKLFPFDKIKKDPDVENYCTTIEENVLAEYGTNQRIVKLKGVDENFNLMSQLDSLIYEGNATLKVNKQFYAVAGLGLKYELGLTLYKESLTALKISAPVRGKKISTNKMNAFNKEKIMLGGVFTINADFDSQYIIVPIEFSRLLLGYKNEISAVEINFSRETNLEHKAKELAALLGENYKIKTRNQKNEFIYQTNQSEKWITFLILSFILLIASFNMIASLTMLILEKKKDIRILKSMGAKQSLVKGIFFTEGMLINFCGAIIGLILGYGLCLLQQNIGLVRLEGGIVDFYPIKMEITDFFAVLGIVTLTGIIFSYLPVRYLTAKHFGG
jgi:lipoprotein-releasing system permease protein